jgi:cytochrome c
MFSLFSRLFAALLMSVACVAAQAANSTPREARALFDRAVQYMQANGADKAFAAFNDPRGAFVHKDLYVFVIDRQGVYHASGAAPAQLVGLNVLDTRDASGAPLFHNMLEAVSTAGEGKTRYVWLNRTTNRIEPKQTYLRRIGDYVLGVGYYAPRSSPEDAKKMLDSAVSYTRKVGVTKAASAFNDPSGGFARDDLYVFVVDLDSARFVANGMNPALSGTDAGELHDAEGHPLMTDMIALARSSGEGAVEYVWRNPVTNAVEHKRSYIRREGKVLVGVGYYVE